MSKKIQSMEGKTIEQLRHDSQFCGMDPALFTVVTIAVLAMLLISFPYLVRPLLLPLAYHQLRDGIEWPIRAVVRIWYALLGAGGTWSWSKHHRMKAAQKELERWQQENNTPQP